MHLIPKRGGGRRPIGILATLVRLWEKALRDMAVEWRRPVHRGYNAAAGGRTVEHAVWRQALFDEAGGAEGLVTGAILLDLVKAFEMVKLQSVWEAGVHWRFPASILRLMLETFAFARHLVYQGAVAEAANALTAILAGGGFATDAL